MSSVIARGARSINVCVTCVWYQMLYPRMRCKMFVSRTDLGCNGMDSIKGTGMWLDFPGILNCSFEKERFVYTRLCVEV
jgi:hypothetical protein